MWSIKLVKPHCPNISKEICSFRNIFLCELFTINHFISTMKYDIQFFPGDFLCIWSPLKSSTGQFVFDLTRDWHPTLSDTRNPKIGDQKPEAIFESFFNIFSCQLSACVFGFPLVCHSSQECKMINIQGQQRTQDTGHSN